MLFSSAERLLLLFSNMLINADWVSLSMRRVLSDARVSEKWIGNSFSYSLKNFPQSERLGSGAGKNSLHASLNSAAQLTVVLLLVICRAPVQFRRVWVHQCSRVIWRLCVLQGFNNRLNV